MVQEGVGVKHHRRHILVLGRKSRRVSRKTIIPPPDHGRVGKRSSSADKIARCSIQRRQLHEKPLLVPSIVDRLHRLLESCRDQFIVVAGEINIQLRRIANVVDADPERDEGLVRVNNVFEHWLGIVDELFCLIDELDGPVVVQWQILDGDVSTSKGKVPQLDVTGLRVGEALFRAAIRYVLNPVRSTVCSAVDVFLLDSV